jgi:Tfp pilus assembly protein PilW
MRRHRARGTTLVELLMGAVLALVALAILTAAVASGARLLVAAGARGELEDTAQLTLEAFIFDLRRAGYSPTGLPLAPLVEAAADRLTVTADLDGDGSIDATSEESAGYVCNPSAARLSRVTGRQSLPLADGVLGCALRYFDAAGAELLGPALGLDPATRARVRAVRLEVTLGAPGLSPTQRATTVALRAAS